MNIIIVQISTGVFVKSPINAADPVEKAAATRIPVIIVTNATNFCTVVPRYLEMMFGMVYPSFLSDMNPEKKSCTAPIKIVPKVIHRNAAGPNRAP